MKLFAGKPASTPADKAAEDEWLVLSKSSDHSGGTAGSDSGSDPKHKSPGSPETTNKDDHKAADMSHDLMEYIQESFTVLRNLQPADMAKNLKNHHPRLKAMTDQGQEWLRKQDLKANLTVKNIQTVIIMILFGLLAKQNVALKSVRMELDEMMVKASLVPSTKDLSSASSTSTAVLKPPPANQGLKRPSTAFPKRSNSTSISSTPENDRPRGGCPVLSLKKQIHHLESSNKKFASELALTLLDRNTWRNMAIKNHQQLRDLQRRHEELVEAIKASKSLVGYVPPPPIVGGLMELEEYLEELLGLPSNETDTTTASLEYPALDSKPHIYSALIAVGATSMVAV